jgi:hypothetical protein
MGRSILAAVVILSSARAQNAPADKARVLSVSPGIDQEIFDHQRVRFDVQVHYSLASVDRALMAVYVERYENGPDGCDQVLKHNTEGGALTPIHRGDGNVMVHFDWHETNRHIPFGAAFLAIGINFWADYGGRPRKQLARFGTSFCRPVLP